MLREKPIGIYATEIQCDQNIKIMKKKLITTNIKNQQLGLFYEPENDVRRQIFWNLCNNVQRLIYGYTE